MTRVRRCFVGLGVSPEAAREIRGAQRHLEKLPPDAARRIRTAPASNLHLTLKFLGDTPSDQLATLEDRLRALAAEQPQTPATLTGLGAFPNPRRPRAVFADVVAGRDRVVGLMDEIEGLCTSLGFSPEKKPREPHVTIARVTQPQTDGPLTSWIEANRELPLGEIRGDTLILFESELHPEGSRYHRYGEWNLVGRW